MSKDAYLYKIHQFCTLKYNTTFDQFSKIDVNGENESHLFNYIKSQKVEDVVEGVKNKLAMKAIKKISTTAKNPEDVQWNFTKFLVDKDGNVVERYSPTYNPEVMEEKIKELLEI